MTVATITWDGAVVPGVTVTVSELTYFLLSATVGREMPKGQMRRSQ